MLGHPLQALEDLGLVKPSLGCGVATGAGEVPGELSSCRQIVCFIASRGKASPGHDPAEGRCQGAAGWHPAQDHTS